MTVLPHLTVDQLLHTARHESQPKVARRIQVVAMAQQSLSGAKIARLTGEPPRTIRRWVQRYKPEFCLSEYHVFVFLRDVVVNGRPFWLLGVCDQTGDEVGHEVDGATVAGVLDLADIFELIDNGLDQGSLA